MEENQSVTSLRKGGQLEEAYEKAVQLLSVYPDQSWYNQEMAWVCYEQLKLAQTQRDHELFVKKLQEIGRLYLVGDQTILYNALLWQLQKWLPSFYPQEGIDRRHAKVLNGVMRTVVKLSNVSTLEAFSPFLRAFHLRCKGSIYYTVLLDHLGFDHFQPADYLPRKSTQTSHTITPLVEQIYNAYAKSFLMQIESLCQQPSDAMQRQVDLLRENFIPRLSALVHAYPHYLFPLYFLAKLHLALSHVEAAREALIPFLKRKVNEFWVWELLGDTFDTNQQELKQACYCRALLCTPPQEMLVGVRESLARVLLQKQLWAEAKTELQLSDQIKQRKWKTRSSLFLEWEADSNLVAVAAFPNNLILYNRSAVLAEHLIWKEELVSVLVTYVNTEKKMVSFLTDRDEVGFYKAKSLPARGQVLRLAIEELYIDRPTQVRYQELSKDPYSTSFYQIIEGKLKANTHQSFAFLENCFVSKGVLEKYRLKPQHVYKARAVKNYHPAKKKVLWEVVEIL